VVELGGCLEVKPVIGTITPARDDGEFKLIRVGELGEHDVAVDQCSRVSMPPADLQRFQAMPGDLLLARAIGSESHLGKASVLQPVSAPLVFDSHVMRLRVDLSRVHPSFLWQWLQTGGGRRLFLKRAGRTAVQFNINATQVADVRLPLPPLHEQAQFLTLAARSRRLRATLMMGELFGQELFDSLAQRAFGGHAPAAGAP
jgi:type I restriction enzyme S subunit